MQPVVVVGAGLAGLSAAVELSRQGIPVSLYEQKPFAGGRAYSFVDRATGETIDNGQHVLIGGYAATLHFLDLIGSRHLLWEQPHPSLLFHHPQKGFCEFTLPSFPSPFHLISGIMSSRLFSVRDKLRLLRAGRALMHLDKNKHAMEGMTTHQWLKSIGQSDETLRALWEPLTLAIMNEGIEKASALLFAQCIHQAFIASKNNATLILPSVGLSELFVDPACSFIERAGGRIHLGTRVLGVLGDAKSVSGIRVADGSIKEASSVIVSIPPWSMDGFPPLEFIHVDAFDSSPIVSIHFWFERNFMKVPIVGVIGRTIQWIFDKRKIAERRGEGGHISCVISAAREIVDRSNEEILEIAVNDVRSVFGKDSPPPLRGVVIREKRATFSSTPSVEQHRPFATTPFENLFLAGDWTSTGLPGTIEGAVISGRNAARMVRA